VFTYVDAGGVRTATDSGGNVASRVWPLFDILAPTEGAEHVSLTPTIQWASAVGNSGYVVVISESDTLVMDGLTVDLEDAGIVWSKDDVPQNATSATVDVPLTERTTYYVWVFAKVGTRLVVAANAEIEFLTTATITLDDALADGTVGAAYTGAVAATGGTGPYTYAVTSGTLPAGLTLASNGAITGTPTTAATSAFTVTATDANDDTGNREYEVVVVALTTEYIKSKSVVVTLHDAPAPIDGAPDLVYAFALNSVPEGLLEGVHHNAFGGLYTNTGCYFTAYSNNTCQIIFKYFSGSWQDWLSETVPLAPEMTINGNRVVLEVVA
jgi:hypothetical protein